MSPTSGAPICRDWWTQSIWLNWTTLVGSRASLIKGGKSVMVLGISSVWPSHQRVTLWCYGWCAGLVHEGPEFESGLGKVFTREIFRKSWLSKPEYYSVWVWCGLPAMVLQLQTQIKDCTCQPFAVMTRNLYWTNSIDCGEIVMVLARGRG